MNTGAAGGLAAAIDRLERRFAEVEPGILSYLPEEGRFDRLRGEAAALAEVWPDPAARPALFGCPVGVKDVFRVDGFPTRAGSRLPASVFEGPEASCVGRLKAAGALVVGKTVSTEFAFFAPGPTRNPRHPEHTPGGSSSGSAAAVAAGLSTLALGTQTYGSISRPAAYCGVVGYKPSYDRIPRDGVVPLSPSLDHVGAMAPGVEAVASAAPVLCGDWRPGDPGRRPVLGVPTGPYLEQATAEGRRHFARVCALLRAAGLDVREVPLFEDAEEIRRRHELIVAAEAAEVHRDWFARYRPLYHERLRQLIEAGEGVDQDRLAEAKAACRDLRARLVARMKREGVDLWISPAAPGPAPRGLDSTGDPAMNVPWTQAGLPTLAIPAGTADGGLPLGLQVAGSWYQDERLIAWGRDLERILGAAGSASAAGRPLAEAAPARSGSKP